MTAKPTIFLSSTWLDLEEHRKIILFTFARLRKWIEAMEYFGALPESPLEECLKAVRRSDIYVGLIGMRYGSKDKQGMSITQREYEEAYAANKKILVYLIDEDNHPMLPKFFDIAEAERLREFKLLLKARHTCAFFSSPQDLAVKVGVDIIHHLDLYSNHVKEDRAQEFSAEMPKLLSKAGYSLGMVEHTVDLSGILEIVGQNRIEIRDARINEILVAGYLAINVCRGNYDILRGILTFDKEAWLLFLHLVRHYGTNENALADFIKRCQDPLQFRLLVRLAGALGLSSCVEPVCRRLLDSRSLDKIFTEYREQTTSFRKSIQEALQSMPTSTLPVIQKYLDESKVLGRWQQKHVFESVAKVLQRRLRIEQEAAS